jgi:vanillate O-demethylase ferredoxin subunit
MIDTAPADIAASNNTINAASSGSGTSGAARSHQDTASGSLNLVVRGRRLVATDMLLLHLELADGNELPAYGPGAHLTLHLREGLERRYSLLVPHESSRTRYVICVKLEAAGRGGSRHIHSNLLHGSSVRVSRPENYFPLEEDAAHSVFIAGGIGITPVLCMAARLQALGRPWELHYAARSHRYALPLQGYALAPERVRRYFDDRSEKVGIDAILANAPQGTHFYCCGPQGMLDAYKRAAEHLPTSVVHFESFGATDMATASESMTVKLARDGRVFQVPASQSILDCLRAGGVELPFSCRQGVCGACETRVVAGIPEHRDMVLSEAERKANKTMMICCSRSQGGELVLDL